ncbi:MAG TPA: Hemin transport protein [Arenimonas sp.]|nr:Hemin transport protein [Arenimonas sp.]
MPPVTVPALNADWPAFQPENLAALGPVLCLHAATDPHLLSGWTRATHSYASVTLDSDGPCEGICFLDAAGACCWQLQRLPDSDFMGWEQLLSTLPRSADAPLRPSHWLRHWPACISKRWRGCAVRLHTLPGPRGSARLAATDVALSGLGQGCAQRLARFAGATL